jgi:hypothetical protein
MPGEHEFRFHECSGSRLNHMTRDYWLQEKYQIEYVEDSAVILIQAGGNNPGFYDVATHCLYHAEDEDYGAFYPDPSGACKQAIDRVWGKINSGEI